jgi:hypothetical protein
MMTASGMNVWMIAYMQVEEVYLICRERSGRIYCCPKAYSCQAASDANR